MTAVRWNFDELLLTTREEPTMKTVLAGGAKNYLDDLKALNSKTTDEMLRGINEGYLDAEGAEALAEKLKVAAPRVKRRFHFYFTTTVAQSIPVNAYDAEEALAEAQRMHQFNVSYGDIHYGSGSRFNTEGSRIRRVFSEIQTERPTVENLPPLHSWELERSEAERNGQNVRDFRSGDLRNLSLVAP